MSLREPCWQCDLEIPHVCYHGMPDARWGLHDGAIDALEAAQRHLAPKRSVAPKMRSTRSTIAAKPRSIVAPKKKRRAR